METRDVVYIVVCESGRYNKLFTDVKFAIVYANDLTEKGLEVSLREYAQGENIYQAELRRKK